VHRDNNSQLNWQKLHSLFLFKAHTNTHQMTYTTLYGDQLTPFSDYTHYSLHLYILLLQVCCYIDWYNFLSSLIPIPFTELNFFFLLYFDDPIVGLLHKISLFYLYEMLLHCHTDCFAFLVSVPEISLTGSLSFDIHHNISAQITTLVG